MNILRKVGVFGDSILKGIQVDTLNNRYHVDNHIDVELIERTHSVEINNYSLFGCTIKKGISMLKKRLCRGRVFDMILLEYGGNDCDFLWKEISDDPNKEHLPITPIETFYNTYIEMIKTLKENHIMPILATLPPIDPQRFFDWFCKNLNKEKILNWLGGSVNTIYRFQEKYSRMVEQIAAETNSLIVDLRGAFLKQRLIGDLLCDDGTHPNTKGQKLITDTFLNFWQAIKTRARRAVVY